MQLQLANSVPLISHSTDTAVPAYLDLITKSILRVSPSAAGCAGRDDISSFVRLFEDEFGHFLAQVASLDPSLWQRCGSFRVSAIR
jgi:hypothetical protein